MSGSSDTDGASGSGDASHLRKHVTIRESVFQNEDVVDNNNSSHRPPSTSVSALPAAESLHGGTAHHHNHHQEQQGGGNNESGEGVDDRGGGGESRRPRLAVQMLLVEELGRRGMHCISLTQLRLMLQFAGCKPQQCSLIASDMFHRIQDLCFSTSSSTLAIRDILSQQAHPPCALKAASSNQTLREQWSKGSLRHIHDRSELAVLWKGAGSSLSHGHHPQLAGEDSFSHEVADHHSERGNFGDLQQQAKFSTSTPTSPLSGSASQSEQGASPLVPVVDQQQQHSEYFVAVIPRVLFMQKMEAILKAELRGNFTTADPLRRLSIVSSVVERRVPLIVFCGGTSGCGKSTLANLLASLLGIRTIVSTDSIREMLRGHRSAEEHPELFASTYEAYRQQPMPPRTSSGTFSIGSRSPASPIFSALSSTPPPPPLQLSATSSAFYRISSGGASSASSFVDDSPAGGAAAGGPAPLATSGSSTPSPTGSGPGSTSNQVLSQRIVAAYEKQSKLVLDILDRMIETFIRRNESVVIEGVHLLSPYMLRKASELAYNGIPCVPVLFQIVNEAKHKERFAIRAKSMTLLPRNNKYVEHFTAIRTIQAHLVALAANTDILIVNNTNVDKSLSMIHECTLACLENFTTSTKAKNGSFMPTAISRAKPKIKGKEVLEELLARREAKRTQARVRSAEARPLSSNMAATDGSDAAPLHDTSQSAADAVLAQAQGGSSIIINTRSHSACLPSSRLRRPVALNKVATAAEDDDDHESLIGS